MLALLVSLPLFACAEISGPSKSGPPPVLNPIQIENQKQGNASWQISNPATSHEIEGYASAVSVPRGGAIHFFVSTAMVEQFTFDIYRMGYYGGLGGRKMQPTTVLTGHPQPSCPLRSGTDQYTFLVECNWASSYTLRVPVSSDLTNWLSGIYLVKLTGLFSGFQSYILFVVTDGYDNRNPQLLLQHAANLDEAYNDYGGWSLYRSTVHPASAKVSFNRPLANTVHGQDYDFNFSAGNFFRWEYHMVRFLERNGYDVGYITDLDTHLYGGIGLLSTPGLKGFLSVGHGDEYWTWQMRDNVENARDYGLNLGFFSADDSTSQARLEDSNRTLVCYKNASHDPVKNYLSTVYFRDPPANRPEDQMIGIMWVQDMNAHGSWDVGPMTGHPLWLFQGVSARTLVGLLGTEADMPFPTSPPNLEIVSQSSYCSSTPPGVLGSCQQQQNQEPGYFDNNAYASVYTTNTFPSPATVFAAGTFQWAWGLDNNHVVNGFEVDYTQPNPIPQSTLNATTQMTVNILTRFLTQ